MNRQVPDKFLRAIDEAVTNLQPLPIGQLHKAEDVGQLSAEAVALEYETAAKAIEAMGHDLTDMQRRLEMQTKVLHEALDEVKMVAALYREKAAEACKRIESASFTVQDVKNICSEARERIQKT